MTPHDFGCPPQDAFETQRMRELDWRYTPAEADVQGSSTRIGEVCNAAIIALAHAYQPIEYGYNHYHLASSLNDDFDYDTLGQCIDTVHEQDLPNLSLDSLRLVDRILATYESVVVDGLVRHASLDVDDDTRLRDQVEASIRLRCNRMLREVERQLHVDGNVTAAEAAVDYVSRLHGTPTSLLRQIYA